MNIAKNYCVKLVEPHRVELVQEDIDLDIVGGMEILGKSIVSLVSSGSEAGGYNNEFKPADYPMPIGHAVVMKVLAAGEQVKGIQPGDLVYSQSPHRLYNRLDYRENVPVPVGLGPERAVMCRFPAISMTTMEQTQIRPADPAIVTGLGLVGLGCAQMLRHCGYEVYAVDPNETRRQSAASCGVEHVLASMEEAPAMRGKAGLVIDCSGSEQAILGTLDFLRKGAEIYLVGVPWRRTTDTSMHELLGKIFYGYLKISSGWEWSLPRYPTDFPPYSNFGNIAKSMEWIAKGYMRFDGIYETFLPEECDQIFKAIAERRFTKTCAMFDWTKY